VKLIIDTLYPIAISNRNNINLQLTRRIYDVDFPLTGVIFDLHGCLICSPTFIYALLMAHDLKFYNIL